MTRQEYTGERPLEFSQWIRHNLPSSSTGFTVTNQDWVFWNWKTRKLLLAEEKTHNGDVSRWFRLFIKEVMHPALAHYCRIARPAIEYRGYHLIQFSNTSPSNGDIYFDRLQIAETELKQILSFEIYPPTTVSRESHL